MKTGYVRFPRLSTGRLWTDRPLEQMAFLDLLLTAAENPCISTANGAAVPVGRGEVHTSIHTLSGRLNERPLHVKRALTELEDRGLIRWHNRLPAESARFLITVQRFYRYSSFVCDTPDTVRVYRSIMDKPWYADGNVKAVYLHLLAQTHTGQIGGAHVGLQVAELAYAVGISKRAALSALRTLADTGDIDYLATDRRCEVVFRAPPDERVIHVDFNRAGSETG